MEKTDPAGPRLTSKMQMFGKATARCEAESLEAALYLNHALSPLHLCPLTPSKSNLNNCVIDTSSVSVSHSVNKEEGNKDGEKIKGGQEGNKETKKKIEKVKKTRSSCGSPVRSFRASVCWVQ